MSGMEILFMTVTGLSLLCLVLVITASRYRTRKIMENMNHMVELAISGDFDETLFDESLLSAVETRLAHYLSASAVSAKNLTQEKEKIKELIADISHQTKTPIANILLYTQLLEEQEIPVESRECVKALEAQAQKLSFLIGSLVKTSRLEAGIFTLHPKQAAVMPILENIKKQIQAKADEKNIEMILKTTETTACFDSKWTEEAIYNIVDNAVKYTPKGGKVTMSCTRYELFTRIDITDTGMGIAPEEHPRIFGRFYRSAAVSEQPGVGIGLYLSRQIVSEEGAISR